MAVKKTYAKETKKKDDFKMEILEECGSCTPRANGDVVKLRYIKWGDNPEKYDLRAWRLDEDGNERTVKGNTFTGEELEELYNLIGKLMED